MQAFVTTHLVKPVHLSPDQVVFDEALFDGLLPDTFALVPQRGDGFGERLLSAAEDILAIGYGAVCLIDSD